MMYLWPIIYTAFVYYDFVCDETTVETALATSFGQTFVVFVIIYGIVLLFRPSIAIEDTSDKSC